MKTGGYYFNIYKGVTYDDIYKNDQNYPALEEFNDIFTYNYQINIIKLKDKLLQIKNGSYTDLIIALQKLYNPYYKISYIFDQYNIVDFNNNPLATFIPGKPILKIDNELQMSLYYGNIENQYKEPEFPYQSLLQYMFKSGTPEQTCMCDAIILNNTKFMDSVNQLLNVVPELKQLYNIFYNDLGNITQIYNSLWLLYDIGHIDMFMIVLKETRLLFNNFQEIAKLSNTESIKLYEYNYLYFKTKKFKNVEITIENLLKLFKNAGYTEIVEKLYNILEPIQLKIINAMSIYRINEKVNTLIKNNIHVLFVSLLKNVIEKLNNNIIAYNGIYREINIIPNLSINTQKKYTMITKYMIEVLTKKHLINNGDISNKLNLPNFGKHIFSVLDDKKLDELLIFINLTKWCNKIPDKSIIPAELQEFNNFLYKLFITEEITPYDNTVQSWTLETYSQYISILNDNITDTTYNLKQTTQILNNLDYEKIVTNVVERLTSIECLFVDNVTLCDDVIQIILSEININNLYAENYLKVIIKQDGTIGKQINTMIDDINKEIDINKNPPISYYYKFIYDLINILYNVIYVNKIFGITCGSRISYIYMINLFNNFTPKFVSKITNMDNLIKNLNCLTARVDMKHKRDFDVYNKIYKYISKSFTFYKPFDFAEVFGYVPDCMESAVRNFINIMIFDTKTNDIDISLLPNNTLKEVQEFYKQYNTINNRDDPSVREKWLVIFNTVIRNIISKKYDLVDPRFHKYKDNQGNIIKFYSNREGQYMDYQANYVLFTIALAIIFNYNDYITLNPDIELEHCTKIISNIANKFNKIISLTRFDKYRTNKPENGDMVRIIINNTYMIDITDRHASVSYNRYIDSSDNDISSLDKYLWDNISKCVKNDNSLIRFLYDTTLFIKYKQLGSKFKVMYYFNYLQESPSVDITYIIDGLHEILDHTDILDSIYDRHITQFAQNYNIFFNKILTLQLNKINSENLLKLSRKVLDIVNNNIELVLTNITDINIDTLSFIITELKIKSLIPLFNLILKYKNKQNVYETLKKDLDKLQYLVEDNIIRYDIPDPYKIINNISQYKFNKINEEELDKLFNGYDIPSIIKYIPDTLLEIKELYFYYANLRQTNKTNKINIISPENIDLLANFDQLKIYLNKIEKYEMDIDNRILESKFMYYHRATFLLNYLELVGNKVYINIFNIFLSNQNNQNPYDICKSVLSKVQQIFPDAKLNISKLIELVNDIEMNKFEKINKILLLDLLNSLEINLNNIIYLSNNVSNLRKIILKLLTDPEYTKYTSLLINNIKYSVNNNTVKISESIWYNNNIEHTLYIDIRNEIENIDTINFFIKLAKRKGKVTLDIIRMLLDNIDQDDLYNQTIKNIQSIKIMFPEIELDYDRNIGLLESIMMHYYDKIDPEYFFNMLNISESINNIDSIDIMPDNLKSAFYYCASIPKYFEILVSNNINKLLDISTENIQNLYNGKIQLNKYANDYYSLYFDLSTSMITDKFKFHINIIKKRAKVFHLDLIKILVEDNVKILNRIGEIFPYPIFDYPKYFELINFISGYSNILDKSNNILFLELLIVTGNIVDNFESVFSKVPRIIELFYTCTSNSDYDLYTSLLINNNNRLINEKINGIHLYFYRDNYGDNQCQIFINLNNIDESKLKIASYINRLKVYFKNQTIINLMDIILNNPPSVIEKYAEYLSQVCSSSAKYLNYLWENNMVSIREIILVHAGKRFYNDLVNYLNFTTNYLGDLDNLDILDKIYEYIAKNFKEEIKNIYQTMMYYLISGDEKLALKLIKKQPESCFNILALNILDQRQIKIIVTELDKINLENVFINCNIEAAYNLILFNHIGSYFLKYFQDTNTYGGYKPYFLSINKNNINNINNNNYDHNTAIRILIQKNKHKLREIINNLYNLSKLHNLCWSFTVLQNTDYIFELVNYIEKNIDNLVIFDILNYFNAYRYYFTNNINMELYFKFMAPFINCNNSNINYFCNNPGTLMLNIITGSLGRNDLLEFSNLLRLYQININNYDYDNLLKYFYLDGYLPLEFLSIFCFINLKDHYDKMLDILAPNNIVVKWLKGENFIKIYNIGKKYIDSVGGNINKYKYINFKKK